MPTDYHCGSCGLFFSLGWFHGISGSTFLLVCRRCGNPYRINHYDDDTPDRVKASSQPLHYPAGKLPSTGSSIYSCKWVDCTPDFDVRFHRGEAYELIPARVNIQLHELQCIVCNAKGSIVGENWPELHALWEELMRQRFARDGNADDNAEHCQDVKNTKTYCPSCGKQELRLIEEWCT